MANSDVEALKEDIALARAIEQGEGTPEVSREEVFRICRPARASMHGLRNKRKTGGSGLEENAPSDLINSPLRGAFRSRRSPGIDARAGGRGFFNPAHSPH